VNENDDVPGLDSWQTLVALQARFGPLLLPLLDPRPWPLRTAASLPSISRTVTPPADATRQTCLGTGGNENTIRVATSDGRMFKIAGRPPAAPCLDGPNPPREPPLLQSAFLS